MLRRRASGELHAATIGDLDEERKAWLVRAKVSKTRRARWVVLPDDLFTAILERLPAREDRDPAAPLVDSGRRTHSASQSDERAAIQACPCGALTT